MWISIRKARGQMIRMALVLELLRWCAERPGEEAPAQVAASGPIGVSATLLPCCCGEAAGGFTPTHMAAFWTAAVY